MRNPASLPDTPVLRMENIAKAYSGATVLHGLTFSAMPGDLTVVYGPPAAGKSVLVRVLTGLETPDSGRIILRGEDVTGKPPADRNIGYVPQSFALYPHLSVRANIAYPLDLAGVPKSESANVVANAASMLKIEEHLDKKPDQLSGGQKQRVAIARGIAKRTDFFVLDDPLAGLDFKLREQLVDDLRGLNAATGASVLYVTSDVIEAMTLGDDLAVLSEGTIIESGVPERLYREPHDVRTMALVGFPPANFLAGSLEQQDGRTVCVTSLFAFPVDVANGSPASNVLVGVRPERIHLAHRAADADGASDGSLSFPATVILREDLGGEDVVYLEASGVALTMVDRDHNRDADMNQEVTVSIVPHHLALFDVASGARIGNGARISPPASRLPPRQSTMAEIRVEQLTKTFGSLRAVDDVSFTFPNGRVTCLLGPSGCGKTTLMRIIAGLEKQTAGAVYFGEQDVSHLSPSKRNIGMVFQYPVVYRGISVYRNIELPLQSMKLSKPERTRRVEDVIRLMDLTASADLDVSKLDNGTRQKVSVAREVARRPQFILFDEPITNVDAASKLQLKRSLKELTRSLSQTIIYVTHDQTEAMTLADQIALMEEGKIVQCAPPRELYNHPDDRFGGWFLGNPGMVFFDAALSGGNTYRILESPLFPQPVAVNGAKAMGSDVIVGIRPEHIRVSSGALPGGVPAFLERKTIQIGGQYLVALSIEGLRDRDFKAKVAPSTGERLPASGPVNVELPLEQVSLFDAAGDRIAATLHPAGTPLVS